MTWDSVNSFESGGQLLFQSLEMPGDDASTRALIVEACRAKDRLDRLNLLTSGDVDAWTRVYMDGETLVLKLDTAVSEQRQLATVFRQLLAEIQRRQGDRGAPDENDGLAGL